jgi:EmrB/QacA subfamily drug resistance transporter
MRRWLPLVAICLGTFMLLLDVTIVNVALPAMATDLETSFSSLQWVVDIYALVLAALLLSAGSVSDLVGRRVVYLTGLVVFALSSLICGVSPNAATLITFRAVQGVGAAAMFATTVALINATYSGRDRGSAYGIWGAVSGAAAAAGPIVGGVLTQHLSWRWIFLVNVPISVLAIVLSLLVLAGGRGEHRSSFDPIGMLSFTGFAALTTYGFVEAGDEGWGSATALGSIVLGVLLLVGFVLVELRIAHPMLDLSLFRDRRFAGAMLVAFAFSLTAFSYLAYSSIWLQSVTGLSPLQAGLVYLPLSLASFTVAAVVGRLLHRRDPRWFIAAGMLAIGVGGVLQAHLHAGSRWPALQLGLLIVGVGVGLVGPTLASSVMSAVPIQRGGMASGGMNTLRQLGFAFGIAVLGTLLQSRVGGVLNDHQAGAGRLAAAVSGGQSQAVLRSARTAARPGLDEAIHSSFASGLNLIFLLAGGLAILVALLTAVLLRPVAQPVKADEAVALVS